MPFYEINLGMGPDYTRNVIATREEMEVLIEAIRDIDCGNTGYCFRDAYFRRDSPELVHPTAEQALTCIKEWIEREKEESDRHQSRPAEQQQAEEFGKRRKIEDPVSVRLNALRQKEHRADNRAFLARPADRRQFGNDQQDSGSKKEGDELSCPGSNRLS